MTKGSKTIRAIILTCFYWIRPAGRRTARAAVCGTQQSRRKCCRGVVRPCSGAFLIKCVKLVICQMLHRICRHLFTNTRGGGGSGSGGSTHIQETKLPVEHRERKTCLAFALIFPTVAAALAPTTSYQHGLRSINIDTRDMQQLSMGQPGFL